MSTQAEYESVDLTEDEASSDGYFSQEGRPLNFVDCGKPASSMSPIIANTPPRMTQMKGTSPRAPKHMTVKRTNEFQKKVLKSYSDSVDGKQRNSIGKFLSVQIKPPSGVIPETQYVPEADSRKSDTVCLDSDEEEPVSTSAEQQNVTNSYNQTAYTPKHMGKVVVIKKNNKFYKIVIPHNVMPDINQSIGPVLINIPEVGPLVITTDPQVRKANSASKNQVMQQLLNLDDIQQKKDSVVERESTITQEQNAREAVLCDKKYCWTFVKGRKRDLEGFTSNDRLGFYGSEGRRARKCWRTLDSIISKKKKELTVLMNNYNNFKDARGRREMIKLVKINEIVGKASKNTTKAKPAKVPGRVTQTPRKKEDELVPYYDSDLLLTKKIVILNNEGEAEAVVRKNKSVLPTTKKIKLSRKERVRRFKERIKNARALGATWSRTQKKKIVYNTTLNLKPCYVQMVRDDRVEEAYRKYCKDLISAKLPEIVQNKPSVEVKKKVMIEHVEKPNLTPTSSIPQPVKAAILPKQESCFFDNISKIFLSKVIKTEERFKREMNFLKPILMVHDYNLRVISYSDEFSKNNIVYVVEENGIIPKSMLVNPDFISAVELGYVKLVDSNLFCKFVTGRMELALAGAKRAISDHSYCLYKK